MSYFSEWNKKIEDNHDEKQYNDFVKKYYETEQSAYDLILKSYPENLLRGKAKDIAETLGYASDEMLLFVGFLEGINPALKEEIDLDKVDEDTELDLEVDFETLLYKMHEAQAPWLFDLNSWENVFDTEKKEAIGHQYRVDNIAVSDKIGRNEPCFCGSGKKYKKCHGK